MSRQIPLIYQLVIRTDEFRELHIARLAHVSRGISLFDVLNFVFVLLQDVLVHIGQVLQTMKGVHVVIGDKCAAIGQRASLKKCKNGAAHFVEHLILPLVRSDDIEPNVQARSGFGTQTAKCIAAPISTNFAWI
jgi:hypothetical protein